MILVKKNRSSFPYYLTCYFAYDVVLIFEISSQNVCHKKNSLIFFKSELFRELFLMIVQYAAFVDISPEETLQKSSFEDFVDSSTKNGAALKEASTTQSQEGTTSDRSQSIGEVLHMVSLSHSVCFIFFSSNYNQLFDVSANV